MHGEGSKMSFLKARLESSQGVPVHMPANGEEISIERAGGGGFAGGGRSASRQEQQHQRVFGAVAAPSVAAAVVGKMPTRTTATKKKVKLECDAPATTDPVSAAGEAVDAGWRPSPAHSALVELVLRPRRGGGFGVGLVGDGDDGSESEGDSESDSESGEEGSGDEEMEDAQQPKTTR